MNIDFVIQGILLDVSVLTGLLDRGRYSHGRTIYYKRLSMALKSMQQPYYDYTKNDNDNDDHDDSSFHNKNDNKQQQQQQQQLSLLESFGPELMEFQKRCNGYQQRQLRINKRINRQERWGEDDNSNDNNNNDEKELQKLQQEFVHLKQVLCHKFPSILSRIHHASLALWTEIQRGYFLPFCTVAMGAIARIRSLLLQMGRWGLVLLQEIPIDISTSISTNTTSKNSSTFELSKETFESIMTQHYMEPSTSTSALISSKGITKQEDRIQRQNDQMAMTLATIGLHIQSFLSKKSKSSSNNNNDNEENDDDWNRHDKNPTRQRQQQPSPSALNEDPTTEQIEPNTMEPHDSKTYASRSSSSSLNDEKQSTRKSDSNNDNNKQNDNANGDDDNDSNDNDDGNDDNGDDMDQDDDDIGETVVGIHQDNNNNSSNKPNVAVAATMAGTVDSMDRNMSLVQHFKKKSTSASASASAVAKNTDESKSGDKKKDKKRKSDSHHSENEKKKKKKKKKKESKKGGDYFDELFG